MRHRSQSTYRNSGLARTKVKKNKVVALFSNLFMQQRSEIGLVEDRSNSTTIIRIIVGLLLIHLIIIGGIILHGKVDHMQPTTTALVAPPTMTVPTPVVEEPKPVPGPTANPAPTHITQAAVPTPTDTVPSEVEIVSPAVTPTPVEPTPVVTATETVNPKDVAHKLVQVTSGDNLRKIAERNQVTVDAILAINPEITNPFTK